MRTAFRARQPYADMFLKCAREAELRSPVRPERFIKVMMDKRLERDVLRYQPDLVLINGSLNWNDELGDTAFYKQLLTKVVTRIQEGAQADIILLTSNGIVINDLYDKQLKERVNAIREVAAEKSVCLADTYAVWERAREMGCPWKELLANGANHPGVEGDEVYAITLMKLMEL